MRIRYSFSDSEKNAIKSLFSAGLPVKMIAAVLGRPEKSVHTFLRAFDDLSPVNRPFKKVSFSIEEGSENTTICLHGVSAPCSVRIVVF